LLPESEQEVLWHLTVTKTGLLVLLVHTILCCVFSVTFVVFAAICVVYVDCVWSRPSGCYQQSDKCVWIFSTETWTETEKSKLKLNWNWKIKIYKTETETKTWKLILKLNFNWKTKTEITLWDIHDNITFKVIWGQGQGQEMTSVLCRDYFCAIVATLQIKIDPTTSGLKCDIKPITIISTKFEVDTFISGVVCPIL